MSILQETFVTEQNKDDGHPLTTDTPTMAARLSESFWFCLSLLLFIIMGPFSAIAVLIGLFSLASSDECKEKMVEPESI